MKTFFASTVSSSAKIIILLADLLKRILSDTFNMNFRCIYAATSAQNYLFDFNRHFSKLKVSRIQYHLPHILLTTAAITLIFVQELNKYCRFIFKVLILVSLI